MDSALNALKSVNVFSDQKTVIDIGGNEHDGFVRIRQVKGYIDGLFYKVGTIFNEALIAMGSSNLLTKTLDRTLSVIDSTRIFGDIDYVVSGKLFADAARDVLEVVKRIVFTGVDVLSTLLFLESANVISLSGIASAIGKIPLVGSALVEFGVGSFIQISLIVGGIIEAVQDIREFKEDKMSGSVLAFKLVKNVADVAMRVYLVMVGYHLLLPILTIISKAIGCCFDYQGRLEDKVKNEGDKIEGSVWDKPTVLSVVQAITRVTARAFNSLDFNNKMAKWGITVFDKISCLSGLVSPLKALKSTIDLVGICKTVAELPGALTKKTKDLTIKVVEVAKTISGLVMAVLESMMFFVSHNLLGLGRLSGNIGFNVLGVVGRLSLAAVKNTFVVIFSSLDIYLTVDRLRNPKRTEELTKTELVLTLANLGLKIGVLMLAGATLLFAGFTGTTAFFVLAVASCTLDLALTFKVKILNEVLVEAV